VRAERRAKGETEFGLRLTAIFSYFVLLPSFWKLYGIGLPDQVLKQLYYGNVLRLTPGLSHAGLTA
jgi:hypothetical protein